MEQQYDNRDKGVLFKNEKKTKERSPDYQGSINIAGTDHWLSAWIATSKSGKKFLSLSIGKVKEQKQQEAVPDVSLDELGFN